MHLVVEADDYEDAVRSSRNVQGAVEKLQLQEGGGERVRLSMSGER